MALTDAVLLPVRPIFFAIALLLLAVFAKLMRQAWSDPSARRRVRWLLILPAPWIIAVLLGPLGLVAPTSDLEGQAWMLLLQNSAMVASIVLPLGLLPPMRGARRLTVVAGALNLLVTVAVASISTMIIAPGS